MSKRTVVNLIPGQEYELRTDRGMRVSYPLGKTNPTVIVARDLGVWVEPPAPTPTSLWPTSTPCGKEPRSAVPVVPSGLAAGTVTLQQAVDATPAGGILNASVPGKIWREKITINRPITIVGYGAEVRGDLSKDEEWFLVFSSDVTIEGFRCTQSGAGSTRADRGGIQLGGYWNVGKIYDRLTLRNLDLDGRGGSAYMGDLVSIQGGGSDHVIAGNRMRNGGRSAITGSQMKALYIARNDFSDNSTGVGSVIDVGNDGGAVKLLWTDGIVFRDNWMIGNRGRGLWTDTMARSVVITHNVFEANAFNGVFLESSHQLEVFENLVFDNARIAQARTWLWGGGITLSSSDHAKVSKNLVVDNGMGITVVSQQRTDDAPHVEIEITENDVLMSDPGWYAIGWGQDWAGVLFAPASNNRGSLNRIHGSQRFAWNGDKTLTQFNATPAGGGNTRMLTDTEAANLRALV